MHVYVLDHSCFNHIYFPFFYSRPHHPPPPDLTLPKPSSSHPPPLLHPHPIPPRPFFFSLPPAPIAIKESKTSLKGERAKKTKVELSPLMCFIDVPLSLYAIYPCRPCCSLSFFFTICFNVVYFFHISHR